MWDRLRIDQMDEFYLHLCNLSEHDRYMRFAGLITEESIKKYVNSIQMKSDYILVYRDPRSNNVVAGSHIGIRDNHAEIGISVEEKYRGRGIGKTLWLKSIYYARACGVRTISTMCLRNNMWMVTQTRKAGMTLISDGQECMASKEVPPPSPFVYATLFKQWSDEQMTWSKMMADNIIGIVMPL